MATKKASTIKMAAAPTRAALAKMVKGKTDSLHAAIAEHMADIPGLQLHSVHFSLAVGATSDPCGGRCKPGEVCLLSSTGEFECV